MRDGSRSSSSCKGKAREKNFAIKCAENLEVCFYFADEEKKEKMAEMDEIEERYE